MMLCIGACAYATDKSAMPPSTAKTDTIVIEEKSETDFNIDFPFNPARKQRKHHSGVSMGMNVNCTMMFGFVGIVGKNNDAKFQMGRSVEFYMPSIIEYELRTGKASPSISLGIGFGLQHFFGKNKVAFAQEVGDSDHPLETEAFPDGSFRNSSKVNKFAITMPLMIEQKIGSSGRAAIGAMLDFNTHLGATTKYRLENSRHQTYFGSLAMRPITYEIMGALSSSDLGIYIKYVPVNIFKKGYGPDTKNLSVGVILFL